MTKPGPRVTSGADTQPGSDALVPTGFGGGGTANVRPNSVGSSEITDGSVTAADLNMASVAAAIAARSELTGALVQDSSLPASYLSKLPGYANGIYGANGNIEVQDNITSQGGVQYAVWWNDSSNPVIGKRTLPVGAWTTRDLSTVTGNPLGAPTTGDSHYTLAVAVSSDGHVHVMGNQHNVALRYTKTTTPGDITSFVTGSLVGTNESSMSYARFVTLSDGTLLVTYRDGASGNGVLYCNRYNASTGTWVRVGALIDGTVTGESAYPARMVPDSAGNLHVFVIWRLSGSANTNNDISYVKFSNFTGTVAASTSTGAAVSLPATHTNTELVLHTIANGSGLFNGAGADIDSNGYPHLAHWYRDGPGDGSGNTQIYHTYKDATGWHSVPVTSFNSQIDLSGTYVPFPMSRPALVCYRNRTYIIYRANRQGRSGTVRMIDVTPGSPVVDFPICRIDAVEWEPTFDSRAVRDRGELHMVLIPHLHDGPNSAYWETNTGWDVQPAFVLSLDLNQVRMLTRQQARLPGLRVISVQNGPGAGVTYTNTGVADAALGPVPTGAANRGRVLMARLSARIRVITGCPTFSVQIHEQTDTPTGASRNTGTITTTSTTPLIHTSMWCPLTLHSGIDTASGWVAAYEWAANSTGGKIDMISLELAEIEGLVDY